MALPSGYVQIDYIESTGTQYINTSFTPKGSSRIVMDCELTDVSKTSCFFCARNRASSTDSMSNTSFLINGQYRRDYYGTSKSTTASYAANQRFIVDANKETVTYGSDYTLSFTSTSTSSPMPCILMASAALGTTSGSVSSLANYASMKLYSCQIYDNGILVRDFVPCKTDSGELGLYDNVNGRFYANAGTGTFIAGADVIQDNNKHKTLIDSTGYEIKSGRVLIAGTGYDIKKGRTLIDGTGYDIKFNTPVGELEEGTLVKINESGSPVEFYVAKHDYESGLNGSGRTLVVRKDCHSKMPYSSRTGCTFPDSVLYTWLNNTYTTYLDDFVRSAIGKTKFEYTSDYIRYTYATGECAVFLLGVAEVDPTNDPNNGLQGYTDGTLLPIANTLKIAYLDSQPVYQWTRAWAHSNGTAIVCMNKTGRAEQFRVLDNASTGQGVRPIFTLPSEMAIDSDFNIIPS